MESDDLTDVEGGEDNGREELLYADLGRLLTMYTAAEASARNALRFLSGVNRKTARIMLEGLTLAYVAPTLRKLASQGDPNVRQRVTTMLAQLTLIERDKEAVLQRIVPHHRKSGDVFKANRPSLSGLTDADVEDMRGSLRQMAFDCYRIMVEFNVVAAGSSQPMEPVSNMELQTWLYEPVPKKK